MSALIIDFLGEIHRLDPTDDLTFGREADVVVDTNRHLHRRLGLFRWTEQGWCLHNTGSAIPLDVVDRDSSSRLTISPGSVAPIPFKHAIIMFQAGRMRYELTSELDEMPVDDVTAQSLEGGIVTVTASSVPLNREQRQLLNALAAPLLLNRAAGLSDLPTNRAVANRLGWTITKFNRKLDTLCTKFDKLGVPGLKGEAGALASSRRERLIDHVVTVGLVTNADLELLDGSTVEGAT